MKYRNAIMPIVFVLLIRDVSICGSGVPCSCDP